jgi:DNA-binding MarR family transcriptional regulator
MDSRLQTGRSGAAVARELNTSLPRVARAIERLGIAARLPNGRISLHEPEIARLRAELGVKAKVAGLTDVQVSVLSALRDAPLGLASIRAVARRAGVSATASSRALDTLQRNGFVIKQPTTLAAGTARRVDLLQLDRRSLQWRRIAPTLARVRAPEHGKRLARPAQAASSIEAHGQTGSGHGAGHRREVPRSLLHLFWNTAPSQRDGRASRAYVARRLLRTLDFDGLAWGASNLRRDDWLEAQRARGLAPSVRALARNLAAAADDDR